METPPSNFSQYPRGQQPFGTGQPYRTPGVYFDYISTAFRMIFKNPTVYILGTFVVLSVFYALTIPMSFLSNYISYGSAMNPKFTSVEEMYGGMFKSIGVSAVLNLIPGTLFYMALAGISICAIEESDQGSTSFNSVFKGFRNFGSTFVCCLLMYIAMTLGMYLFCIPFFFLGGLFCFVPIISATEGLGVGASFSKGIDMVKPYLLPLTGLYFVSTLVSGLGVLVCCVGVFATMPVLYIVIGLHYRDFRGPSGHVG